MHKSLYRWVLLLLLCFPAAGAFGQVAETPLEQHIRAVYKLIQERRANRNLKQEDLYDQLKDTAGFKLPVGIGNTDNGQPPVIIDSIRFLPDHAEITAYLVVQLPGSERELMFAGRGIPITRKGGLVGTARLELVNDQPLNLFGDSTAIVFKSGSTFAEFDCNGFKRLGIGADIALSPKLVKENADGSQNLQDRVRGHFEVVASDLNDIITAVNIEPFQIRGVKNVTFTIEDAIVDLSDYHNSASMVFPAEYSNLYGPDDLNLWRGFYLRSFSVTLPEEIKDNNQKGKRKSFSVRNALIDEKGFSGEILAQHLIPLESGDMGGWAFSLDQISLGFVANQFKYGSLAGGINVPITGDTTKFAYSAIFHPGQEYVFTIQPSKEVNFDIFKAAHVTLERSSFLEVAVKNKTFQIAANLTGTLSVSGGVKGGEEEAGSSQGKSNNLSIPDIRFEQLVVSTQAPFIHSGTFSLSGNTNLPKLGGYGLSVDEIQFVKDGEDRGIGFTVHLNLMGGNGAFAADASLAVLGRVKDENGRFRFRYSRTKLSRIAINIDQGPFALKGSLLFFNDHDIYGDGFRGDIDARIKVGKSSGGFKVAVTALFGSVNDNRYWYADALAEFPGAIPIFPPVVATGFGGGLYYGVKQLSAKEMQAGTAGYEIGTTRTGVTYKPDANAGLGIKASMNFALSNQKVLNGIVGFEMAFNRSGGVSRISFRGQVNILTQPMPGVLDKIKTKYSTMLSHMDPSVSAPLNNSDASGQISADLLVDADFENSTLFSEFKAYINVAGGALKGIGPNGLAGSGIMYVGPDGWYLHVGTPSNPVGVELLGLARSRSYFMVGKDLPGSPPPPPGVSEILGGMDLDYMRDLNALGKGSGFAFGAGLDFDTGDMTFLVFYARLAAGLGFDIMLKNYGEGVRCEGSSSPIGINGWYANGQAYAYFQGKIGIKVNLFFKKGRFDIINLGAAVVLQGKLPNPTWMRGVVGGRFSILGGLVKGNCRFEVTLGKECRIVGNNLFAEAGVQVIADATPGQGDGDVNVFNAPQLVFNMPIGQNFNITDNDNKVHTFRARLEYFNVRDGGANIEGAQEWNADNTTVVINTPEVLPPQKTLRLTARVAFEENVNGSWTPYLVDNKPYAEVVDNEFTTGEAPDVIVPSNVAYAYPVQQQLNYYKDETRQGYIILKKGQGYLFNAGADFKQVGRVAIDGGTPLEFNLQYNSGKISFTMPDGMQQDKTYSLSLVNVPVDANASIDRNVQSQQTQVANGDAGDVTVQTKKADGAINNLEEKVIYNYAFHSSRYSTFNEKIDRSSLYSMFTWPIRNGVYELGYVINNQEMFDQQEINAAGNSQVLQFEAILDNNTWYQQYIYPYVYQDYGASPYIYINWRNLSDMGLPPVKGVYLRQTPNNLQLQEGGPVQYTGLSGFIYNLPHYMERDYLDVQGTIANAYIHRWLPSLSDKQAHMVTTPFTPVSAGPYRFRIKYVLPGTGIVTSSKELTIQNTIAN